MALSMSGARTMHHLQLGVSFGTTDFFLWLSISSSLTRQDVRLMLWSVR